MSEEGDLVQICTCPFSLISVKTAGDPCPIGASEVDPGCIEFKPYQSLVLSDPFITFIGPTQPYSVGFLIFI